MSEELLAKLSGYDWPGNVRELRNTIERATILAGSGVIDVEHLPSNFGEPGFAPVSRQPKSARRGASEEPGSQSSLERRAEERRVEERTVSVEVGTTVDEAERQLILKTLQSTQNNKTKAAEILGISSKTLQNKLKEYSASSRTE